VTDTTSAYARKHAAKCVRRASGLVLTRNPEIACQSDLQANASRQPMLLTSGSESAFIGAIPSDGRRWAETARGRAAEDEAAQNTVPPFSFVFRGTHSTIARSHSTFC
jgi:hypothetical protein